jgi:ribosomal protein S18 acetylase RimI-like enzyme
MKIINHQRIRVFRVADEAGRQQALSVMRVIYRDEKNWVQSDDSLIAPSDLNASTISWFVTTSDGNPVGVLRVLYAPPLDLYKTYGFKVVAKDINLDEFIRNNLIAEIGRFAILPEFRRNVRVAATLMAAAARDTMERGFTHYITDVFEGERHSPYKFHSRVMGFQVVATHEKGELNCECRRITMLLDLRQTYLRLRLRNNWIFRTLTNGWDERLHDRLLGKPEAKGKEVPVTAAPGVASVPA